VITRILCPISGCDWHHDSPDVPPGPWPWKGSIEDTVAALLMDRAVAVNRICREHFETHTLIEWLTDLQHERARADAAEAKLTAWILAIEQLQGGPS
jgi:hypothetical protein